MSEQKVPEGYKQTEIGVIPEDWDVAYLNDLSDGGLQNGLFFQFARKGKGVKIVNVGDLYLSSPIKIESLDSFDATADEVLRFGVNDGDLFFTRSSIVPSGIAYCNWIKLSSQSKVVFDSHVIRFHTNTSIVNPMYLYAQCISGNARNYFVANAKTATMTTIDQGVLGKCPVPFAPLPEQTAIAEALSNVDTLVEPK